MFEHRKSAGSGEDLHVTGYSLLDDEPSRNRQVFDGHNDNRIQGKVQDEAQRVGNEEVPLAVETEVEPIESSTQRFT